MVSVHVGDDLLVTRITQQFHSVRHDGFVCVGVSLASGGGHCVAEPTEARVRIVLDDLVDACDLESVVQILDQELAWRARSYCRDNSP